MPPNNIPQFVLTCIKSDYPQHLCVGIKYKVDPVNKDFFHECPTYWFHPIEIRWVLIGNFGLSCFNTEPIKDFIAKKKGVAVPAPVTSKRQRPVIKQRQRPKQ